jgi:hypothetical protein
MRGSSTGRLARVRLRAPEEAEQVRGLPQQSKVVTCLLLIAALGCGLGAVIAHRAATTLRDQGHRTVGEVIEVHDALRGSSYLVVRFRDTAGREITAEVGNYLGPPPERG